MWRLMNADLIVWIIEAVLGYQYSMVKIVQMYSLIQTGGIILQTSNIPVFHCRIAWEKGSI